MKLIIDIPDKHYQWIKERRGRAGVITQNLYESVCEGIPLDDFLKRRKEPIDKDVLKSYLKEKNLCASCTNVSCEFQSGIKRSSCAFYMSPHLEADEYFRETIKNNEKCKNCMLKHEDNVCFFAYECIKNNYCYFKLE